MTIENEKYEVVYHKTSVCILDIGLDTGTVVLGRASKFGIQRYAEGCNPWIHSGVFITVPEWAAISYDKTPQEIIDELKIDTNKYRCALVPSMTCSEITLDKFTQRVKSMPYNNFIIFGIRSDIEDWWSISKLRYCGSKILLANVIGGGCLPIAYPIDEQEDTDNIDDAIEHIIVDSLKYIEGEMPPIIVGDFWRPIYMGDSV